MVSIELYLQRNEVQEGNQQSLMSDMMMDIHLESNIEKKENEFMIRVIFSYWIWFLV